MKKFLICLLLIEFSFLPICTFANDKIEDEFAQEYLKNVKPIQKIQQEQIVDDFAQKNLKHTYKRMIVNKDIVDDFVLINLKDKKSNVKINTNYDYTSLERTILKINPLKTISTKKNFCEGMEVTFVNKDFVKVNSVDIPKGAEIIGRIETISPNNFRGIPAELIIDNFYLKSNPNIYFNGRIDKTGANRLLWVYPSSIVLMAFFGCGPLLWLVKGGHAKIRARQSFEIFYSENYK